MSDFDTSTRNVKSSPNSNAQNAKTAGLKSQAVDAGADLKQRAADLVQTSTDAARDKLKDAADAAKDVASSAADKLQDQAREQQRNGADFVGRLADNIREAARAFENDVPIAARSISSAAGYVDVAAEKIRNGSVRDLLDGATDFARRQPAAFLGLSVLAGFAAVRFLKASARPSSTNVAGMSSAQPEYGRTSPQGGGASSSAYRAQNSSFAGRTP
ncbi:hypothetical protein [Bradyrhizobium sp.]|uniref:hypothetical protein n=1 Tax=Bradyrhizobium sp. TaxID=376 RepID=UPI0025C3BD81|nr:hypothetical protein [Bradyrhizobium sp.]